MRPIRGGYTIEVSKRRWWWLARVVTIDVGVPELAPAFRSRSRDGAIEKAKSWCDRREARSEPESIEYLRETA
jgi:hypothetical protein